MCKGVSPACMPVYYMCMCSQRSEEGFRSPGTVTVDDFVRYPMGAGN